jgi:hypothetical protein
MDWSSIGLLVLFHRVVLFVSEVFNDRRVVHVSRHTMVCGSANWVVEFRRKVFCGDSYVVRCGARVLYDEEVLFA